MKGLRNGMDLLLLLLKEEQLISSLSKNFKLPELHGSNGLERFLVQFEAAVDSEFPNYQVCYLLVYVLGYINQCFSLSPHLDPFVSN